MCNTFVHLRARSAFSLSEGAILVPRLIKLCQQHNMPAIALTDTNNMFGTAEFATYASNYGIQPIPGQQFTLSYQSHKNIQHLKYAVILLAQNEVGYKNIIALSTLYYTRLKDNKSLFIEDVLLRSQGVIMLTGGMYGILHTINLKEATEWLLLCQSYMQNRVYIELMRPFISPSDEQKLLNLADNTGIAIVATNNIFYALPEEEEAHNILMCVEAKKFISEQTSEPNHMSAYFKSMPEMIELFQDLPEAINNTILIAKRCHYFPRKTPVIFPKYKIPEGSTDYELLQQEAFAGLKKRLTIVTYITDHLCYEKRLYEELQMIKRTGFCMYFLIVHEFIRWAKEENIMVGPGRGSGAGSLVAWALGITDIDSMKYGLIFERFLNPDRVSLPDFDIDFCQINRHRVIEHLCNQYGYDRVAQIVTFGRLQPRAVIKDVGRVLGMPHGQVDKISKLVPFNPNAPITLQEAIDTETILQEWMAEDATIAKLIAISLQLEGLYRHASVHAAGIVIGDKPLSEMLPLYYDHNTIDRNNDDNNDIVASIPATQFDMKWVEHIGLIKFDLLGLRTLTILQETEFLLNQYNIKKTYTDLALIPVDDPLTYQKICELQTLGVFQLESKGMKRVISAMQPQSIDDIMALVSLFRPGPMDQIPQYIAGKSGEKPIEYFDERLEAVLAPTYGVMVYQEQVMQIAQIIANYTMSQADILRRAMGKKIKQEMDTQRAIFIDGAVKNNTNAEVAATLFDQMEKFAGYGFNKSHAAAYAIIGYYTGYVKAHHPMEFMTVSMRYDITTHDRVPEYCIELQKMNIKLLCPTINISEATFSPDYNKYAIRYGFSNIKGVGETAARVIVTERDNNGAYTDIFNFWRRCGHAMNKRQLEALICAGVFDLLHQSRKMLFDNVRVVLDSNVSHNKNTIQIGNNTIYQQSLFDLESPVKMDISKHSNIFHDTEPAENWGIQEQAQREFSVLGTYMSVHPVQDYPSHKYSALKQLRLDTCLSLNNLTNKRKSVYIMGIIVRVDYRISRNKNKYAFVMLSDTTSFVEIRVFNDMLHEYFDLIQEGKIVVCSLQIVHYQSESDLRLLKIESIEEVINPSNNV